MLINTKNNLRKHFIDLRNGFNEDYRISADKAIASKLFDLTEYKNADVILIYVSVGNEIDTRSIIKKSLALGKTVAVPYCKNNQMLFYPINSFEDLVCTQFGIPTIDPDRVDYLTEFINTLCIVPALSIDKMGNRLGYGGGYYDRFLSDKHIDSIALCREKQLTDSLPAEDYDVKMSKLITENKIIK